MEYIPDNWVLVKIQLPDIPAYYKVLAGWSGGYLYGNSWRLNSGITEIKEDSDYWIYYGQSGSIYKCHKQYECLRNNISGVYAKLMESPDVSAITAEELYKEFRHND